MAEPASPDDAGPPAPDAAPARPSRAAGAGRAMPAVDDGGADRGAGRVAAPRSTFGGPRAIGALLPAVIRPALRNRSPAAAQLIAEWAAIVGPALAARTVPRRLAAGTLTIVCSGPVALELQHLTSAVIARINTYFGRKLVERLRFAQDVLPALASAPAPPQQSAPQPIPGLPPGELHDALAALGAALRTVRRG